MKTGGKTGVICCLALGVALLALASGDTSGRELGGLEFDGSDDYVEIPRSDSLDITMGLTIEAWIRPADLTSTKVIVDKSYNGAEHDCFLLRLDGANLEVQFYDGAANQAYTASDIITTEWQHVAVTCDRANVRMFRDGVMVSEFACTIPLMFSGQPLLIGKRAWPEHPQHFSGLMCEVKVYARALTADEIRKNYSDVLLLEQVVPEGLVSWWKFDVGDGNRVSDILERNDGIIHGAKRVGPRGAVPAIGTARTRPQPGKREVQEARLPPLVFSEVFPHLGKYYETEPAEVKKSGIVVVYPSRASWAERYAAGEFAKYATEVTGKVVPALQDTDPAINGKKKLILVGKTGLTGRLEEEGRLDLSRLPTDDGYIIRSVSGRGKRYLVLLSRMERGTIYAVYHYFEKYCGVGFFFEGDRIPTKASLPLTRIDVTESPRFKLRFGGVITGDLGRPAMKKYSGAFWDFTDWQKAIDWTLKMRFNSVYFCNHYYAINPETFPRELTRKVIDYSAKMGLEYCQPGGVGFTRAIVEDLGPGSHIYNIAIGSETRESADVKIKRFINEVRATKEVDPDAELILYDLWYAYWSDIKPEDLKYILDRIPRDIVFGDMPGDWGRRNGDKMYKFYDYYWGRKWYYAWFHSLYPQDTLWGNPRLYIDELRELARDPRATNCEHFFVLSEPPYLLMHPLFGHVVSRLAWDPLKVDKTRIFADYVRLRYPKESVPNMLKSIDYLLDWLDDRPNTDDYLRPIYRLNGIARGKIEEDLSNLTKSLETALLEKDRLDGDELYEAELTEIARAYLGRVSTQHMVKMWQRYEEAVSDLVKGGDADRALKEFEKEVRIIEAMLSGLEQILSTRPDFSLVSDFEEIEESEKTGELKDAALARKRIKQLFWVVGDYHRIDSVEVVHHLYRREVAASIQELREKLEWARVHSSRPAPFDESYKKVIAQIKDDFLNKPIDVKERYRGTTAAAVYETYQAVKDF